MAEPVRHRQTKGAATDMFDLQPPRHISTLRISPVAAHSGHRLLSEPTAGTQPCRREPLFMPQNGHSVSAVDTRAGRCRGRLGHPLAGAPASPELRRQLCNALRLMSGEEVGVTEGGDDILVVVVYFVENAVMAPMSKNTTTSWPGPPPSRWMSPGGVDFEPST